MSGIGQYEEIEGDEKVKECSRSRGWASLLVL
jgi:hypothetical protein